MLVRGEPGVSPADANRTMYQTRRSYRRAAVPAGSRGWRTTGEQLHRATGIASNPRWGAAVGADAGCAETMAGAAAGWATAGWATAAGDGGLGDGGLGDGSRGDGAGSPLSSSSLCLDGTRTIARTHPSPSSAAEMAKAMV